MKSLERESKRRKREEEENKVLSEVYDLILDENTLKDEREILMYFKNSIEKGKDFQREIMHLAEGLRRLSLKKFRNKESLSKSVCDFYMKISTKGFFEKNLAIGICASKLW